MGWFRSGGRWGVAALAVALLAGCASGAPAEPDALPALEPSGAVALNEITDRRSLAIEYPTVEVPEGVTPEQLDWMLQQLLPAAQRSIDVAELSARTEEESVAWVLESVVKSERAERATTIDETFGTGYSFLVGSRFAPEDMPRGAVHVLGQEWTAVNEDNILRVKVRVEQALPFEEGVVVVLRELRLSADLSIMAMDGTFVPGVGYFVRFEGLDDCAILLEGAARPGDLSEVREHLAELKDREGTGLSAWATAENELEDPAAQRAACQAD